MKTYRRMTWTDRLKLEALYNAGRTYADISRALGFAVSSLFREVQRGLYDHLDGATWLTTRRYSAEIAQQAAEYAATSKGRPLSLGHRYDFAADVLAGIRSGYSPDVIVGRRKRDGLWTVSTSTLYRYIARGYIPGVTLQDLRQPRRKNHHRVVRAARPPKGQSIESRPQDVASRKSWGHWELDSVIGCARGHGESVLTLTERKTRYEIILRVPDKTSASTVRALDWVFRQFPQGTFKSITVDNGSEFMDCWGMEHDRKGNKRTDVYYCHPYTSCERGTNERHNGILRRWLPKGHSMKGLTQKRCDEIARAMNDLPRRILGYATPAELFAQELAAHEKNLCNTIDY